MIAGCEFGSQTHNELAKQATDAILKRLYQCTTLQPTGAILIIECLKTALLSERPVGGCSQFENDLRFLRHR